MRRFLILILILTFGQSACTPAISEATPASTGRLPALPDTWTPEPSAAPSSTATARQRPTASSTPTQIPAEATDPPDIPTSFPTLTPFPQEKLSPLKPGEDLTITEIHMVSEQVGWAFGFQQQQIQRVLYTADGGKTWQDRTPVTTIPKNPQLRKKPAGYFFDRNTALVLTPAVSSNPADAAHVVWRTEDAGMTWKSSAPLSLRNLEPDFLPREFYFINSQIGWLRVHLGYMMMHEYTNLYVTEDGGRSWKRIIDPGSNYLQGYHNTGMAFASMQDGWVTKDNLGATEPILEQTRDGGRTWEILSLPSPPGKDWYQLQQSCQTSSPAFPSTQVGLLLVNCYPFDAEEGVYDLDTPSSTLYATSDWGENWHTYQFPTPVDQLVFVDLQHGFAFGKVHYRTRNGGADWNRIKSVSWQGDFHFLSTQLGWAVARKGEDVALVKTSDGGLTYQQLNPAAGYNYQN